MADQTNTAETGTNNAFKLCYIHHKPNGPVHQKHLEQTLHTHNDTVGFIASKISGFMGVVGATSNDARVPLFHVFDHHAHQLCSKTQ